MFIPGAIEAAGAGVADACGNGGPGFIVGGGGLGAIVMLGIGAIVGAGDAFVAAGVGALFFTGAGVAIGIPGMGAIVGCAATTGEAVRTIQNAAMANRVTSKGTSGKRRRTYYAP